MTSHDVPAPAAAWPGEPPEPVSLAAVLEDVRSGRSSVADEVERALAHVRRTDDVLHAWVCVDEDGARRRALALDGAAGEGLALRGAVIGVKDIIDVAGLPTRAGTGLRASRPDAERDAPLVGLLRGLGAIVLGKTATTEYAYFHPAPTRNPRDLARTPGGSSSGSAAAVAAGTVPLAIGTQTAGSIVRPAAFCAIAGLKPTFGRLSLDGVLRAAPSLDTLGLFTASSADLLPVVGALFGADGAPQTPRTLGWWPTTAWERVEPGTRAALEDVVARLGERGVVVKPLAGPDDAPLMQAQRTLLVAEMGQSLGAELAGHEMEISAELRALLDEARSIGAAQVEQAQATAARARTTWAQRWEDVDALLTPATFGPAPAGLSSTGDPELCRVWTMLGWPSLALPVATTDAGLPVGLQLVGRPGTDARLVGLGAGIERLLSR